MNKVLLGVLAAVFILPRLSPASPAPQTPPAPNPAPSPSPSPTPNPGGGWNDPRAIGGFVKDVAGAAKEVVSLVQQLVGAFGGGGGGGGGNEDPYAAADGLI